MRKVGVALLAVFFSIYLNAQNYALDFDGTNDYVSLGSSSSFKPGTGSFTVEAWVRPDNVSSGTVHRIITYSNGASTYNGFEIRTSGAEFYVGFGDGSAKSETHGGSLSAGKWYYVALVRNVSDGKIYLYINGVEITSVSDATSNVNYSGNLIIGGRDTYSTEFFEGGIDEVRVWNTARTADQIKDNLYKKLTGSPTGLVAYYYMSNGSGTTLTDNSGNSHSGTFTGSPDWINSGSFSGSRNCLDFDASSSTYVRIADNSTLDITSAMTLEAWVYPTSYQDWDRIITKNWFEDKDPWLTYALILTNDDDGLESGDFVITISGTDYSVISSDDVPLNSWTHIAGTWDGSTMKIYINGYLVNTTNNVTGSINSTSDDVTLGKNDNNAYNNFNGKIDEARIWNKCRTQQEIRENMNKPLSGDEQGLVAYFRFDYGDAGCGNSGETKLYDITSNNNDGTLNNFTLNSSTSNWVSSDAFNTWLGSESTGWSTAANWSSGSTPGSGNNLGIYSYNLANQPTLSSSSAFNNIFMDANTTMTLNSSTTLTNNNNFFVYGTLTGSGDITNNGYLEIDHNSSCNSITNNTNKTFKVSSGTTMSLSGSFTNNGTFNGEGTAKFNGTSSQSMNGESYNNVEINNSAGVSLSNDATVSGTLTITSGDLDLNGHNIDLGTTGTLSETGGTLKGSGYIKATRTLNAPSSENPGGLGAVITSSANLGSTEVKRGHSEQTGVNSNKSILRYYDISPANNSGLNASLKFYYKESELNGSDEADLRLFKSKDAGSTWSYVGGTVNTTDNYVFASGLDDFSRWSVTDEDDPLPVSLLDFYVVCQPDSQIELNWITASETGNQYFEIQKSFNGKDFITIAKIDGAGNSNIRKEYSYITESQKDILVYYRLKQTDFNGNSVYLKTVVTDCESRQQTDLWLVYPNPFDGKIMVFSNDVNTGDFYITVKNALGETVFKTKAAAKENPKIIGLPENLPSGIYFVSVLYKGSLTIKKIIKE